MPDTQPITTSFPWLTKVYKPVYDNNFQVLGDVYTDEFGITLTDETGDILITEITTTTLGDRYRLI